VFGIAGEPLREAGFQDRNANPYQIVSNIFTAVALIFGDQPAICYASNLVSRHKERSYGRPVRLPSAREPPVH
jgi:hypothetical protein